MIRACSILYLVVALATAIGPLPSTKFYVDKMIGDARSLAFDELLRQGDGPMISSERIRAYTAPFLLFAPFILPAALAVLAPFLAARRAIMNLYKRRVRVGLRTVLGFICCLLGLAIQVLFLIVSPEAQPKTVLLIMFSMFAMVVFVDAFISQAAGDKFEQDAAAARGSSLR